MNYEKRILVPVDPWDKQKLAHYLEKQALKGWMFCGFEDTLWKFERIEPKEVHFCVTYFLGYIEGNDYSTQRLLEFWEYCAHDGWELAGSNQELQIFYSKRAEPVPIDTDPKLEVRTMQIMALRKLKPQLKHYLLLVGLSLLVVLAGYFANPVRMLYDPNIFLRVIGYGGILLSLLLQVGEQYLWLWQAKRYADRYGEYPHHLKRLRISTVLRYLIGIGIVDWVFRYHGLIMLISLLIMIPSILIPVVLLLMWLDKKDIARKTVVIITVVAILMLIGVSGRVVSGVADRVGVEQTRYAPVGSIWAQYEEMPPISAEEYCGPGSETTDYHSYVNESLFLAEYRGWQDLKIGEDTIYLQYTVLEAKWDALYDICLDEYRDSEKFSVDAAPWGAEQAYQYGTPKELQTRWLLCYEDRVVYLHASERPTPEQKALIGQCLGLEGRE